jgi:hypothetical protein
MYDFGVIAFEVRTDSLYGVVVRSFVTGSHGATPVLRDGQGYSSVFDAERG